MRASINTMNTKQTIAVGISGGVDSSVAAYLLKEAGYDVIGIFVKTWSPEWLPCTWVDEKRDAMRVCATLDIPFYFLDASDAYKEGVADYMIKEYAQGRTPNPDVLCNRVVKFGVMWQYARQLGATAIATGHYAQVKQENNQSTLLRGIDTAKDQSYFLWMITPEELRHTLFPIGGLPKSEVRAIAKRAGLMTAEKKDSQGVCFLGDIDMRDFLSHYITQVPGAVVDTSGTVIGRHDGVWFYTLGERHGFEITEKNPNRPIYYVVGKSLDSNELIVSDTPHTIETREDQRIVLRDVVMHHRIAPYDQYIAQIRYHGELLDAVIESCDDNHIELVLRYTQVIAPGQSIVLYKDDKVIAGGIIDTVS